MTSTDALNSREQLPFPIQTEIPTASDWCQRWQQRTPSWRHVSEGGFDARRYTVEPLPEEEAKAFVLQHHYSASYPSAKERFGLYLVAGGERRLCGVAVFGVPVSEAVLTKPLPDLVPYVESLECSRFVLLDECPANSESWFLARTFEALLTRGVRGVVSFADPVPRRSDSGALIAVGHVGTIYQASNAAYCGRATARTLKLLPDGTVFNSRAAQKIRRQEQGHEYAAAQHIRLGAPVPRAGADPALWLRDALLAVGARNVRHAGPHRYVFRLGRKRREREGIRLGIDRRPYPKCPDPDPARP
ncbi:hypothetical protein ACIBL8_21235 [Streptomyces sp. NPDC050523]|uniref:Mom family adenine methylcarbamoylation protein n=1 Tax=Streptomyces sp. NPDC050523 TaxID=3365622 RepID=UPI00379934D9